MTQQDYTQHPITPTDELVGRWLTEAADLRLLIPCNLDYLATQAAQWGADQELEACCREIQSVYGGGGRLRSARRPKPPNLKEQALDELDRIPTHDNEGRTVGVDVSIIRRALEALPND